MRDLICDVIKLLASNWYVGKISEYDKIVIENWKKENVEIKELFIMYGLGMEFITC